MKRTLLLLLAYCFYVPMASAQSRTKKVVFVIVDGISRSMLREAPIPNLKKIAVKGALMKAHVGGEKDGYSQTPTISAVGYNSLLTGTWVNKHNVWDNDIKDPNYHYPTIFRLLKDQYPQKKIAVFSSWTDNRTKLVGEGLPQTGNIKLDFKADGYELDTVAFKHDKGRDYMHRIDEKVIEEADKNLREKAPDLSWIYLEYTDDMGHMYGKSPQMEKAIAYMDAQMGRIYEAIEYREKNFKEDWLIVITTDHGRDAVTGKNHGGQSDSERNTWIVTNKKPNLYGQNEQVGIVDIMPSMADFMDIKIPQKYAREIDGVPFLGKVSVAQPKVGMGNGKLEIGWKAVGKVEKVKKVESVKIYLTETNRFATGGTDDYRLIGTVPVSAGKFGYDLKGKATKFYKVVLEAPGNTVNTWYSPK